MSRTLKDRPYYVLKNDPKMLRHAKHEHLIHLRERVGEREEVVYPAETLYDDETETFHKVPEVRRTYPVYERWTETVPCSLDSPSTNKIDWGNAYQARGETADEVREKKHCHYYLGYYPNIKSGKYWKQKTSRGVRTGIKRQLHQAVKLYDQDDMDAWEDVDINSDSMYDSRGWWYW